LFWFKGGKTHKESILLSQKSVPVSSIGEVFLDGVILESVGIDPN
jgi:hypothetical protein